MSWNRNICGAPHPIFDRKLLHHHNNNLYGGGGGHMCVDGWAFPLNVFSGNLFGLNFNVQVEAINVASNIYQFMQGKPSQIIIEGNNRNLDDLKKYFDFRLCRILYDDYKNMPDEDIMKHYAEHGHKEKRIIMIKCDWFDPKIYKYLNDDLTHLSDDDALKHFVLQGHNEDRPTNLPQNFNAFNYMLANPDINCMNENEAKYHYASIGRKENRNYGFGYDLNKNKNYLDQDEILLKDQYIESENKKYKLVFQGDGNLVLYEGEAPHWKALWASNTGGKEATHFSFQHDNNAVIYNYKNPIWSSGVICLLLNKKCKLYVENDGVVRIRDENNCAITQNFSGFTREGADIIARLLGFD